MNRDPAPWAKPVTLTALEFSVLRHIRQNPGKSRTEIASALDISKSMLTKAVGNFDNIGLVQATRAKLEEGERGQPPVQLSLREGAFHTLGFFLSSQGSAVVRSDLGGRIHQAELRDFTRDNGEMIACVIADLDKALKQSDTAVLGVGIAVLGIVGEDGALFEVTPTQRALPIREIVAAIRAHMSLPVYWETASYCLANFMAHQPGATSRCLFHLTLDFGVGGGLIWKGEVFRGGHSQAANFGGLIDETGKRPSLTDLARHLGRPVEQLTPTVLSDLLAAEDPQFLDWVIDRGRLLSSPLSAVVQLFNPDTIIFGGFFPSAVLQLLADQVDLTGFDIANRRPLTKPVLRVSDLIGSRGYAEAAAFLPVSARLLGQKAIVPALS